MAHLCIGDDIFKVEVVHDSEIAVAKRLGHGHGHLSLGLHQLGLHLHHSGLHLLLARHGLRAAAFRGGLSYLLVGFGALGVQLGADVGAHVHVGDVDG